MKPDETKQFSNETNPMPANPMVNFSFEDGAMFDNYSNEQALSEEPKPTPKPPKEDPVEPEEENPKENEETPNEEDPTEGYEVDWQTTYAAFKNDGLFQHVEIEEGAELNGESFLELQKKEYEAAVTEQLNRFASELDDTAKRFIAFKQNGGRSNDFIQSLQEHRFADADIEKEEVQRAIIKEDYRQKGLTDAEQDEYLNALAEGGKIDHLARKLFAAAEETRKAKEEQMIENAKKQKQATEQSAKQAMTNVLKSMQEEKDFYGFKLTDADKRDIYNMLFTVDADGMTGFQKKLNEAASTPKQIITLAKLLHSNMDFSHIERAAQTKATKEAKENLDKRPVYLKRGKDTSQEECKQKIRND